MDIVGSGTVKVTSGKSSLATLIEYSLGISLYRLVVTSVHHSTIGWSKHSHARPDNFVSKRPPELRPYQHKFHSPLLYQLAKRIPRHDFTSHPASTFSENWGK